MHFLQGTYQLNCNQEIASKKAHVTHYVHTHTVTKYEYKTLLQYPTTSKMNDTHEHAGTISGKPFSCRVDSSS